MTLTEISDSLYYDLLQIGDIQATTLCSVLYEKSQSGTITTDAMETTIADSIRAKYYYTWERIANDLATDYDLLSTRKFTNTTGHTGTLTDAGTKGGSDSREIDVTATLGTQTTETRNLTDTQTYGKTETETRNLTDTTAHTADHTVANTTYGDNSNTATPVSGTVENDGTHTVTGTGTDTHALGGSDALAKTGTDTVANTGTNTTETSDVTTFNETKGNTRTYGDTIEYETDGYVERTPSAMVWEDIVNQFKANLVLTMERDIQSCICGYIWLESDDYDD